MTQPAQYDVIWVDKAPSPVDGSCDHAPWPDVEPFSPMSILGQPTGQPPEATTVKACFDADHLYLHYDCRDGKIIATYTDRDQPLWQEDVVEMFVSPDCDLTRYFEFNFSPKAVIFDARITNPDRKKGPGFAADTSWDAAGLRIGSMGQGKLFGNSDTDAWWSVEVAIPFTDLGVATPNDGDQWRANVFRIEYAHGLVGMPWSPMPGVQGGFHQSDCFGTFTFRR